jgi:xanthosine utilization system XapX-like protein
MCGGLALRRTADEEPSAAPPLIALVGLLGILLGDPSESKPHTLVVRQISRFLTRPGGKAWWKAEKAEGEMTAAPK